MIDSPCHYCEFRHPACHDDCQVYADWAAKNYKNRHIPKPDIEVNCVRLKRYERIQRMGLGVKHVIQRKENQ